jgi:transcriptional regulator with XRE-family HTH domain
VAAADVWEIDRDRVLGSDLVIHLCHFPSTGAGQELDFATNALIPIALVSHSKTTVSRMINGLPGVKFQLEYTEPEDLRAELRDQLLEIRPVLEVRKLAFASYDTNLVGDRIRLMREELGLTRQDVADAVPYLTVDLLRQVEESTDRKSNPTLLELRQIATVLKTTVADLVEPDLGSRLAVALQDWVSRRRAARSPNVSERDKNRIMRRLLYRILESLEEESQEG